MISNILNRVINFILGIIETLLTFRIVLKLLGANPATPFVNWLYSLSTPLIAPFVGILPTPVLGGRFVLEFSTIFAMLVYGLFAYLVEELINYLDVTRYHTRREV